LAGDAHLLLVDVCQEDTLGFVGGFIQRVLPIFSLHQSITQDMVIYMACTNLQHRTWLFTQPPPQDMAIYTACTSLPP